MLRKLYDLTELQGNPSYLSNILPGGAGGSAVAGTTSVPYLKQPTVEQIEQTVQDNTAGFPAISGKLLVMQYPSSSTGAVFVQSAVPNTRRPLGTYGVVNKPAINDGFSEPLGETTIVINGPIQAYCTSGAATINPGTYLVADGLGGFTSAATMTGTASTNGTSVIVTPQGATGTSNFSYEIGAYSADGSTTAVSAAGSSTTSNANLSSTNNNKVTWTDGANSKFYAVIRSAAPTGYATGVIGYGTAGATGVIDYGQAVIEQYPGANTTVFNPTGTEGQILAVSLGTLAASTSTPTLVPVWVGGF